MGCNIANQAPIFLWCVLQLSGAVAWQPGEVCTNSSYDPAKKNFLAALRGKKLRFGTALGNNFGVSADGPPYMMKDTTKTGNAMYSGYNIDMMDRIAELLGVTYDVVEVGRTLNGTKMSWTEALPGMLSEVDVLSSYSTNTVDRLKVNSFLTAHLDLSGRMVVPKPTPKSKTTIEKMFTFLEPFSGALWFVLVILISAYGVGIWCMEKDSRRSEDYIGSTTTAGAVATSCYYSMALFTASGGPTPMTKGGRTLTFFLGFSIVVIIAAYTANLAAFLSAKPTAIQEMPSLDEAMRRGLKVCSRHKYQNILSAYWPQYKDQIIWGDNPWVKEQLKALPTSECNAIIIGQTLVDSTLKIDEAYCHLEVVGDPLFPSSGGWATNLQSPCLEYAMNFAIRSMISSGTWAAQWELWSPAAVCPASVTGSESQELDVEDMAGLLLCNAVILTLVLSAKLIRHVVSALSQEESLEEAGFGDTAAKLDMGDRSGHAELDSCDEIQTVGVAKLDGETDLVAAFQVFLRDYEDNNNHRRDPLLPALLDKIVATAFPRYDFDDSGTLNSEEEITQITINVFTKIIQVTHIDKTRLDATVACIQQTYRDGDEFIFTAEEYCAWLLPFWGEEEEEEEEEERRRRRKKKKK